MRTTCRTDRVQLAESVATRAAVIGATLKPSSADVKALIHDVLNLVGYDPDYACLIMDSTDICDDCYHYIEEFGDEN